MKTDVVSSANMNEEQKYEVLHSESATTGSLRSFMSIVSGLDSLLTIALAIMAFSGLFIRYLRMYFQKSKLDSIKAAFESTVNKLGSDNEAEKYASAILLRRFFNPKSELGLGKAPYAKETVDVIASLLRREKCGDFQKILADNLKYAPNLKGTDLQRTNLQNAYLSNINLEKADFFNADLSFASLKKCKAQSAIFYQARLQGTVLTDGDFRCANFMQADLINIKHDGADFEGASFKDARNIPDLIFEKLGADGIYLNSDSNRKGVYDGIVRKNIFVSKPGKMTPEQDAVYSIVCNQITNDGYTPIELNVNDYQDFGILSEIKRLMKGCHAVVIFGFKQYKVSNKVYRWWSDAYSQEIGDKYLTSSWVHTEAGIASALNLPLLLVSDFKIETGVFETILAEPDIYRADSSSGFDKDSFFTAYKDWSNKLNSITHI